MAKNEEYKGSIDLISGLRPKNGAKFPIVEAADILTGVGDKRLDADLAEIFAKLLTMATQEYVQSKIAELVASSPEALDTLNELAAALGNDPNFATTVLNQLGTKVDKVAGKGLSTNDFTTDYLSMLLKTVEVYNGEFNAVGNIPTVSSGRQVKDSGVNIKDVMIFKYIWFADIDIVADTSSVSITNLTATPIGSINEFKDRVNAFAVMSGTYDSANNKVKINLSPEDGVVKVANASSYYESLSVKGIAAAAELAVIRSSLYNYTMFNNGDILFTTGVSGVNYKRLPMHEVKYNTAKGIELMGLASPWDKQQINKIPSLESNLNNLSGSVNSLKTSISNMPKEIVFHTEEALLNWISKEGAHFVTAQAGNGANPLDDSYGLNYLILTGREFDGNAFTGNRFQMAIHLATGRIFYRIGSVAEGKSFGGIEWAEITTGTIPDDVAERMIEIVDCTVEGNDATYTFSGKNKEVIFNNLAIGDTATFAFPESAPEKISSSQDYAGYKVTILNETTQRNCQMFGVESETIKSTLPGVFEFIIVYSFADEEWKVVKYTASHYE